MGEKVMWHLDEDERKPSSWNVLLLDKTFQKPLNTVSRVASILSSVLGLSGTSATQKAAHAQANFYANLQQTSEWNTAIGTAQALQSRGLIVRVVPGAEL